MLSLGTTKGEVMTKQNWYVYDYNEERIATINASLKITEGGAAVFSDHLGPIAVYAANAYSSITRKSWEEEQ